MEDMEMKKYENPEVTVINFSPDDILTSSSGDYVAVNPLPPLYEEPT